MSKKPIDWQDSVESLKTRLTTPIRWFPYPCYISVGFLLIFSNHILLGLNARLGSPASVPMLDAPQSHQGSIWMAVSKSGDDIVITTSDRFVFKITDEDHEQESSALLTYLKEKILEISISTALEKSAQIWQTQVILAVDKHLEFRHIRPILYELAKAGISHYAFEVKKPLL